MATESTNFLINFIADSTGIANAQKHFEAINKEVAKLYGKEAKIIGIDKITRDAENAIKATVRLQNIVTGVKGKATVTSSYYRDVNTSPGLRWDPRVQRYRSEVTGRYAPMSQGQYTSDRYSTTIEKSSIQITKSLADAKKSLADRMKQLAIRAAEVIPIWMGLRAAYMGIISAVQDSIRYNIELEKSLAVVKSLMVGSGGNLNAIIEDLREKVEALARETGIAAPEIVNAYRNFTDAGIETKASFDGMNASVKLSIALNGDLAETSRVLADVWNQFSDNMKEGTTSAQFFNDTAALMASLSKTETFRLNEFVESIKSFSASAKSANLSLDEMMILLAGSHTFMKRGSTAGTILARVFQDMAKNADEINRILPEGFNPKTANYFETFVKLARQYNAELKKGNVTMPEIFGAFNVRAGQQVAAFAGNFERFVDIIDRYNKSSSQGRMKDLNEMFGINIDTASKQLDIMKRLREQTGSGFLEGITGANSYADALKRINDILLVLEKNSKRIGQGITLGALSSLAMAGGGPAVGLGLNAFFGNKKPTKTSATVGETGGIPTPKGKISGEEISTTSDITKSYEYQLLLIEKGAMYGKTQVQIEKEKLALMEKQGKTSEEIFKQQMNILEVIQKQSIEYSNMIKSTIQGAFEGLLSGEKNVSQTFSSLQKGYKESYTKVMAEHLSNMVMKTGIGDMFGGSLEGLKSMFGGNSLPDKVESGAYKGTKAGVQAAVASLVGFGTGMNGVAGDINNIEDFVSGKPSNRISVFGKGGGAGGGYMASFGKVLGKGMAIASFASDLSQAYKLKGTGNLLGGAMNLGMSGAMAGMMVGGPLGAAIGGTIGAITGAIQGGKSKTTEEWNKQTTQVTSRIDVTNNQLQLVNRNLLALKSTIQTFMMPTSFYFREKYSVEDEFSLSAGRGIV